MYISLQRSHINKIVFLSFPNLRERLNNNDSLILSFTAMLKYMEM